MRDRVHPSWSRCNWPAHLHERLRQLLPTSVSLENLLPEGRSDFDFRLSILQGGKLFKLQVQLKRLRDLHRRILQEFGRKVLEMSLRSEIMFF